MAQTILRSTHLENEKKKRLSNFLLTLYTKGTAVSLPLGGTASVIPNIAANSPTFKLGSTSAVKLQRQSSGGDGAIFVPAPASGTSYNAIWDDLI